MWVKRQKPQGVHLSFIGTMSTPHKFMLKYLVQLDARTFRDTSNLPFLKKKKTQDIHTIYRVTK